VERNLDAQMGEWLRGNFGATFGCTGRVIDREMWRDTWMYRASG